MTPLVRWLRNFREKWVGTFYEGPQAPERLAKMVEAFAEVHPHATRGDWMAFAVQHAAEAYKSGYMRGYEYTERDPESWRPDIPPDVMMDMMDPDWKWGEAVSFTGVQEAEVPEAFPDEEVTRHQLLETVKLRRR